MAGWQRQREIQSHSDKADLLKLGLSTFYLNRTNRSGIITGGLIGGHAQKGNWKMTARYNKQALIKRINLIGHLAERITVTNQDAGAYIVDQLPALPKKTFVYFDPPYFAQGASLYLNAYDASDHKTLAESIQSNVSHPWIVSYDNVEQISALYAKRRQETFALSYSAQLHYQGSELMIFKDGIKKPQSVFTARSY
jgi:DNA adenine methylase